MFVTTAGCARASVSGSGSDIRADFDFDFDLRGDEDDGAGGGLPKNVDNFVCPDPCFCVFCCCFCRFEEAEEEARERVSAVNFRFGVEVELDDIEGIDASVVEDGDKL